MVQGFFPREEILLYYEFFQFHPSMLTLYKSFHIVDVEIRKVIRTILLPEIANLIELRNKVTFFWQ